MNIFKKIGGFFKRIFKAVKHFFMGITLKIGDIFVKASDKTEKAKETVSTVSLNAKVKFDIVKAFLKKYISDPIVGLFHKDITVEIVLDESDESAEVEE